MRLEKTNANIKKSVAYMEVETNNIVEEVTKKKEELDKKKLKLQALNEKVAKL